MSAPESSQSDVPKDNVDLSERKQTPPALRVSPKPEEVCPHQSENADSSGGECSDFTLVNGHANAVEVSEKIIAKSKERAAARKKLEFLSTPVELKVCTVTANSQRPLPKMEQLSPKVDSISTADVSQDDPPNVPSEFVDTVLTTANGNHSKDICSSESLEPFSLDIPDESVLDLLDMSYCDDLMMDLPSYPPSWQ
ncbi:hypothetical protein PR202_ga07148 [Eleusine coracana subsp. coracana]|uniref:Uncharacterized protein n=1 Tax=Eleusine coracana subsp. coracana TaxID=191504 RepID=A0AAV5BYX2_ELECO|nr:hypothetical protein PR202_ga07148 [Eleusine coracana subsp. coracana]